MLIVLVYTCNILLCLIFDCGTFTVSAQSSTLLALAHTCYEIFKSMTPFGIYSFCILTIMTLCTICPAHISPLLVLVEHTTLRSLFWFAVLQLEGWSWDTELSHQTLFKENVLFKLELKTTKKKKLKLKFFSCSSKIHFLIFVTCP